MQGIKVQKGGVYCFDPKLQKYNKIGTKIGNYLFKQVEAKHFMRVVDGYGMQYDAFGQLESVGIDRMEILEAHTGNTWQSMVVDWQIHGRIADYGRGKQIFLSLKYMHLKDKQKIQAERERKERVRQFFGQLKAPW